ncbi:hypothetical protein FDP41_002186 [Naegleria fowleri]|uniref:Histidine kinase n=1 Tax=Naegleria fowleri TaxID=5763 RepID=A0A6A5BV27_NAEFO|nr:uncharacterized protein FDP41_002186 [Naegleria fowleri]KAF0979116.1 hypothetical protein FDP41_002186 [Naegleria fowleri]
MGILRKSSTNHSEPQGRLFMTIYKLFSLQDHPMIAQVLLLFWVPIGLSAMYCQEKGCSVLFACYFGEVFLHLLMDKWVEKCGKNSPSCMVSKVASEVRQTSDIFIHHLITQMYYGPWFPSFIFSTFKMLVSACDIYHGGFCTVTGAVTVLSSVLFTFLSSRGVEMSELESRLFQRRLVDIFCLQYTVMVGSKMFSHFLAFKNREFLHQQVQAAHERFKNEEKTKFIANLSHEARNPLHCIMGSLQVLNHHFEGEKCLNGCKHCFLNNSAINEIIEDIKENATLLLHILSSSLQMTSLEMGKIKLKHEPFNLKFLLDSLIGVFSQLAHEKQISLHCFFNVSKVPQLLKGDSVRLSQIIMNIISNAIKYTKKGYVRVNCDLATDDELKENNTIRKTSHENLLNHHRTNIRLDFIDTGCGISQDQIHQLFQPYGVLENQNDELETSFDHYFNQSEMLKKLHEGGSSLIHTNRNGLGLSITKMLIHKMKGKIKVETNVGVGTTMTVVLPMETGDNSELENTVENFLSYRRFAFTISIIGQDPCFRNVLKDYLSLMKRVHQISTFENMDSFMEENRKGKDGKSNTVSLVILPEQDYERACQQCFGEHFLVIPTIFKGVKRAFPNLHYLPKPIKFAELMELFTTIESQLSSSTSHNSKACKKDKICQEIAGEEQGFDFSKFSVLLADDNAVNRKVLMKMLQIIGFKDIDTSNDGMECFEKFKQKSYHLVLLDCFMPILSGKEACEMIRNYMKYRHHEKEEMQRIPIIAITANTWEPRDTLLSQGFDDVVYKPFILADFKKLLTSYLSAANQR